MHERQIEELALLLRHLAVEAALESAIGDGAGDRIGLVGPRPSAEHVARKLIENEDERERALGRRLPRCKLVIRGRAPERAKARPPQSRRRKRRPRRTICPARRRARTPARPPARSPQSQG